MIILGIETSCDDTGIAVLEAAPQKSGVNFKILSNIVSSQIKTHAPFGGVVPNLAAREHLKNIQPCLKTVLKEANKTIKDIDLIAVTVGPGLIPSLLIGVNFAKALAYKYNIPIIAVNHLEGHIVAALNNENYKLPAIALLVSGGHTQLILMEKTGSPAKNGVNYKIIGETRDDAAGECFDKTAKLLGLGYPGGPEIAKQANNFQPTADHPQGGKIILPRPMMNQNNFDFSFSGLKTAVLYLAQDNRGRLKNPKFIQELCHETQQAIIDVLIFKTFKAVEKHKAKTIILAGGVAANEELRKQFETQSSKLNVKFLTPVKNLCMDNGAMIAMAGFNNRNKASKKYSSITANANLRIK
jgi:N6-L-threonylcarbamoyladenine synthase